MQIAMTMPVMEPDLDARRLRDWAQVIDDGPFTSLCWGERIACDNPEALTLLGALAAWTDRVRLVTTVIVPQLHDPVMLAKALATGDVLCGGRLTVGLGVGGRQEDYRAVGADLATQTMRGMAERATAMKRVWAGEQPMELVLPVGPSPVQPGGPPLLVGSIGPKTIRSAAAWADGLAGTTLDLDVVQQNELVGARAGQSYSSSVRFHTPGRVAYETAHSTTFSSSTAGCSPLASCSRLGGAPVRAALSADCCMKTQTDWVNAYQYAVRYGGPADVG